MAEGTRIDKYLFAVRLYKTRSLASEECRKGKVTIGGMNVKPSRELKVGETIQLRRPPITRSYKVLALTENRMAAKMVPEFLLETTPASELEILEVQKNMSVYNRERGTGRPTKKERRDLDDFFNV
ncbi:ribosome-associated heat shock protein implicated in the recycling of the 50S subunit [Aquipluma nitroreducens]|uniref:Ribosome-associated heat shock protein implicated in the recycling of the 50S subunit n=1 Tax=Aquipluma nitroreducens TaxID=2010828 RepID=A0A5K7S5J9_9BACT|nr:S4 domain-containing protein [Aquipluma nitroreducens]MDD2304788.1 S4 domain-containing protein [Prolixibacteraceae bacterium]BBE16777.1 ribosome-associated heat shock protein implicated in the recycling of the 50S subunit [Aquipluma nitroreducens]